MTQTNNRLFDELGRLVTDAAGFAQSAREEVTTIAKSQMERLIAEMDLVTRDDHERVKAMAAKALEDNDALQKRVEALEKAMTSGTAGRVSD